MPANQTRKEHLEWCKQRAMEYVFAGKYGEAFNSMTSDLGKHPETANHIGAQLGLIEMMHGRLSGPVEMTAWIKGFN